jgi:L-amino acid N-acyltransferase YncA
MQIQIVPALAADLAPLVAIHTVAFADDALQYGQGPPGYRDLAWHQAMRTQHYYLKLLVDGQMAGGMIVIDHGAGDMFLDTLFIHPDQHNRGIGQAAVRLLEQSFPHAIHWTLHTPHRNLRNHHFYQALGYHKIGELTIPDEPGLAADFCLFVYQKDVASRAG